MKFPRLIPQFTASAGVTDAEGTSAGTRSGWLLGALAVAAVAVPIGWTYWQLSVADDLLGSLGSARAAVRSVYSSARGYGPAGMAPAGGQLPAQWLQSGWMDLGDGRYAARSGSQLAILSQGRTFEIELTGLPPMVCRLVAHSLDGGWVDVRVNGASALASDAGRLLSGVCGWWGRQTIRLTSTG